MSIDLDKRIKSIDTIQTCLKYDTDCVGHNGYFFDEFCDATDLSKCRFGELIDIVPENTNDLCFKARFISGLTNRFRFFIPEYDLNPVEKKYRPYTIDTFLKKFKLGDSIIIRYKGNDAYQELLFTGYSEDYVHLGASVIGFNSLFELYEFGIHYDEFVPFGVLEE